MDKEKIMTAYGLAREAHKGQERKFVGLPYITHLEETSQLLLENTEGEVPEEQYIASLLHDVVEDTDVELSEVERMFGKKVRDLVDELTIKEEQKERLGKKPYLVASMNSMTEGALTIKLCDRLSNIAGLDDRRVPKDFIVWYVKETMYLLDHLDRKLTSVQKVLIDKIKKMLYYLKITRNF
jgi:GTP pyrophosphokinase